LDQILVTQWKVQFFLWKSSCLREQSNKKVRPLFDPFWQIRQNSTPDFSGPREFFSAPLVLCSRNFAPLATLDAKVIIDLIPLRGIQFKQV
jgi:hypothetical protein